MKKRLISLLLAFSMMLTFLPAGAVSAFAEGTADDTAKGTLLKNGDNIEQAGTYQLRGPYTQGNHDQYGRYCGNQCYRKCYSNRSGE